MMVGLDHSPVSTVVCGLTPATAGSVLRTEAVQCQWWSGVEWSGGVHLAGTTGCPSLCHTLGLRSYYWS